MAGWLWCHIIAILLTTQPLSLRRDNSMDNSVRLSHTVHWLGPIPPSIRVFSNESTLRMSWPKYWSFSFSIIPSKEHPGLMSFRLDWLYLVALQGTLKSLLQYHSPKASILQRSAFFTVQLSHPYMTAGKCGKSPHCQTFLRNTISLKTQPKKMTCLSIWEPQGLYKNVPFVQVIKIEYLKKF